MLSRGIGCALAALVSVPAVAEFKPGLGFSVGNESAVIMVPVDIDERFRIEPAIGYRSSEELGQEQSSYRFSDKRASVELGLFKLEKSAGNLAVFYGARLSYSKSKDNFSSPFSEASTTKTEHYGLTPTFGVEYNIADSLSLGGEVFVTYHEAHGFLDSDMLGTGSHLTARFFF